MSAVVRAERQLIGGEIAQAMRIDYEIAVSLFRDGRVAAPFAPHWATLAFSEAPGDRLVRVMTKEGVSFTPSRNKGTGRKSASEAGITNFLNSFSDYVIVDVMEFPTVLLYKLSREFVDKLIMEGPEVSRRRFAGAILMEEARMKW